MRRLRHCGVRLLGPRGRTRNAMARVKQREARAAGTGRAAPPERPVDRREPRNMSPRPSVGSAKRAGPDKHKPKLKPSPTPQPSAGAATATQASGRQAPAAPGRRNSKRSRKKKRRLERRRAREQTEAPKEQAAGKGQDVVESQQQVPSSELRISGGRSRCLQRDGQDHGSRPWHRRQRLGRQCPRSGGRRGVGRPPTPRTQERATRQSLAVAESARIASGERPGATRR